MKKWHLSCHIILTFGISFYYNDLMEILKEHELTILKEELNNAKRLIKEGKNAWPILEEILERLEASGKARLKRTPLRIID